MIDNSSRETWRKMGTDGIQLELALVLGISFGSTLIKGEDLFTPYTTT
jgi:hypothetical protein